MPRRSHESGRRGPRPLSAPLRSTGKKRPAVIVQSDAYAGTVGTLVVAEVTKNLTMANDPACLFIDTSTLEGMATGLSAIPSSRACDRDRVRGHRRSGPGNAVADHEREARRLPKAGIGLSWPGLEECRPRSAVRSETSSIGTNMSAPSKPRLEREQGQAFLDGIGIVHVSVTNDSDPPDLVFAFTDRPPLFIEITEYHPGRDRVGMEHRGDRFREIADREIQRLPGLAGVEIAGAFPGRTHSREASRTSRSSTSWSVASTRSRRPRRLNSSARDPSPRSLHHSSRSTAEEVVTVP